MADLIGSCILLKIVILLCTVEKTVLPRLVHPRTIKLTSFFIVRTNREGVLSLFINMSELQTKVSSFLGLMPTDILFV